MTTEVAIPLATIITWAKAQTWSAFALDIARAFDKRGLTERQENAIRAMYAKAQAPKQAKPEPVANPVTEAGMYRRDGLVYRVKQARGGGNFYALRYCPEVIGAPGDRFVYTPGAIRLLSADDRMSLAEAKALGHQFGQCCVCGAELTDPKSVEAGIGPVCAKRV